MSVRERKETMTEFQFNYLDEEQEEEYSDACPYCGEEGDNHSNDCGIFEDDDSDYDDFDSLRSEMEAEIYQSQWD